MPEATARNKRSSTISKIGRMFGVYGEKEKDKASSSCSTGGSGLSNPASPVMNGNGFEKEEDKVAGVLSVGSSRFASANGSCSSLNKTENMRSLNKTENMRSLKDNSLKDGSFMKKLNSLKVNDDCGSSPAIAEESKDNFSSLTSTMSNPNMSHNTIGVKTRANRSQSVSKNNIRSKDSLKEWINSSGTELNAKHVSKLKNTSNASLQSRDNREPSGSRQPKQTSSKPTSKPTSKPSSKTTSNSSVNNGSATQTKDKYCGRLKMLEDGTHEHFLKSAKRQEKLSTMIKNFLGAKKLRDESVSAVSNILPNIIPDGNVPPSLMSGLMNKVHQNENGKIEVVLENNVKNAGTGNGNMRFPQGTEIQENLIDPRSFAEKYGTCQEVIGRGTFGVVKISHKKVSEHKENLYAVKEFRRRAPESEKEYSQRLAREFCISSSLKNIHIIQTLDLLQDAKGDYCEVMEFCTGGDLYTLVVTAGKLEYIEADCFFKQLVRGVSYMHNMGVAHRDIKPENILLTADGNLKITDFGTSECFSFAWESKIHLFQGVIGSAPYIAPELYLCKEYDLRPADVWACGVVYMAMRTGRQLWRSANADDDEFYQEYLKGRKDANGYLPIESLKRARCRNVIYSILDPVPGRRITAKQILNSEWGREIRCCEAGDYGTKTDNVAVN